MAHAVGPLPSLVLGELLYIDTTYDQNGGYTNDHYFPIPFQHIKAATNISKHTQRVCLETLEEAKLIEIVRIGNNQRRYARIAPDFEQVASDLFSKFYPLTYVAKHPKKARKRETTAKQKNPPKAEPYLYKTWADFQKQSLGISARSFAALEPKHRAAFSSISRKLTHYVGEHHNIPGAEVTTEQKATYLLELLRSMDAFAVKNYLDPTMLNNKLETLIRTAIQQNGPTNRESDRADQEAVYTPAASLF